MPSTPPEVPAIIHRHRRARVVGAAAAVVALAAVAAPADAVVHRSKYWSWNGPANWTASYGAYGITVMGDRGAVLDVGFSSTICANGANWNQSVTNYFASQRRALVQRGFRISTVTRIIRPAGKSATYRRQTVGGTRGGKRALVTFEYDFTSSTSGLNYCYQRSESVSALNAAWNAKLPQLRAVKTSLAYFGPGAVDE